MSKQKTKLDFAKYRTPDLIATIVDIVGLPGAVAGIMKWALFCVAALVVVVGLALKLSGNMTLLWTAVLEIYSAPAGTLIGLTLGTAEFVRRSLTSMTKLVDLLLETSARVAVDVQGLSAGETEMPPTRDLVEDVYEQVILVVTKEVLGSMFGFFGKPVYWLYHVTLNQMVRIAIRFLPNDGESTSTLPKTLDTLSEVTDEQGRVVASLRWTQAKLNHVGGWVRLLVMVPCYALASLMISITLLPLWIAWWFLLTRNSEIMEPATGLLGW